MKKDKRSINTFFTSEFKNPSITSRIDQDRITIRK